MTTSFEQTSFFYLALLFSTSFYFIFSQRGEDDGRLFSLDEQNGKQECARNFSTVKTRNRPKFCSFLLSTLRSHRSIKVRRRGFIKRGKNEFHHRMSIYIYIEE